MMILFTLFCLVWVGNRYQRYCIYWSINKYPCILESISLLLRYRKLNQANHCHQPDQECIIKENYIYFCFRTYSTDVVTNSNVIYFGKSRLLISGL